MVQSSPPPHPRLPKYTLCRQYRTDLNDAFWQMAETSARRCNTETRSSYSKGQMSVQDENKLHQAEHLHGGWFSRRTAAQNPTVLNSRYFVLADHLRAARC